MLFAKTVITIFIATVIILTAFSVNASVADVIGRIVPPPQISNVGFGATGISNILNTGIRLIYIIATIAVLAMFLIGAFQYIVSGGNKEKTEAARKRITDALIGLTLLALTFVILRVLGQILGFEFFINQNNTPPIPTPPCINTLTGLCL